LVGVFVMQPLLVLAPDPLLQLIPQI